MSSIAPDISEHPDTSDREGVLSSSTNQQQLLLITALFMGTLPIMVGVSTSPNQQQLVLIFAGFTRTLLTAEMAVVSAFMVATQRSPSTAASFMVIVLARKEIGHSVGVSTSILRK